MFIVTLTANLQVKLLAICMTSVSSLECTQQYYVMTCLIPVCKGLLYDALL